ncbi:MAG TPA: DsbE family thiol:disulfide interchange protein [Reyranella sp.]|jgi:cytochrome c biogenesis protein CcmG/thiol:disulfide interchange protein DsbE|nr:DsbE family thiol:disulfide interchange protein [Reyranella sp.]
MSRRLLFLLPLATLLTMAGFFAWSMVSGRDPASIGSVMVNRPAPPLADVTLGPSGLGGGKPVLVNFFASWCAPCLAEHPLISRLAEREGATVIGVAWKNKPDEARAWLARLGNPYRQLLFDQDGKLALDWGLSGVPETYLVDARGIVRLHYRRAINEHDLKDTILPLLRAGQ